MGQTKFVDGMAVAAAGASQPEEASRITSSIMLGALVGLIVMVFGKTFSRPIEEVIGLDEYTAQLASHKILWLSAFMIGFAIDIIYRAAPLRRKEKLCEVKKCI